MNRKRIAQLCCAALVASGIGLNIQNALSDYGIGENSLSLVATGGSGSSGSCVESFSFGTCTYSNTTEVIGTVMRCGTYAGKWQIKGKMPKVKTGNTYIDIGINYGLPVAYVIWETFGSQLTHYEWETLYDCHTGEIKVIDGETKEKVVDMRTCSKEKLGSGSSCPKDRTEYIPGSTKWVPLG